MRRRRAASSRSICSAFAGGTVTVTVECTASMADVTLLGVPGTRTFTATATEVIDTYRGEDGP